MLSYIVCSLEDATLSNISDDSRHFHSQLIEISHDQKRLTKWQTNNFDFLIVILWHALRAQKSIKGQVIANFLIECPILEYSKLCEDIMDEVAESNMVFEEQVWQLFFNDTARTTAIEVRVVFKSPISIKKHVIPCRCSLTELCFNNMVEYNALIIDL